MLDLEQLNIKHRGLDKHFINTRYFREAALDFKKNGGRYTLAPIGSKEWYEYWREQEKRCLYGYSVGGIRITGRHYFYLNFTRMRRTQGEGKVQRKVYDFPSFWEIDYDWFWYKEIAWWGCTPEQLAVLKLFRNPTSLEGGKHLSCLKTRRGGFSYKEAGDGNYNFNFVPKSVSLYLASAESFLIGDKILNKVDDNIAWLNQNTDGWWLKNRMKGSTLMHQRASYIDNKDKQEKGFLSEVLGQVIVDPNKARGADTYKIVFEEAGSFKGLKTALSIVVPSCKEGNILTGQISVFGTGGEEGADIEGLDEIFNDPHTYDMLAFVNDWEEGFEASECGVFIPSYMANPSHMDDDGNVDVQAAVEEDEKERDKKRKAKDPKQIDKRLAEFPRTPIEALIRVSVNNFPVNEARLQKAKVLKMMQDGLLRYGEYVNTGEGMDFIVKPRHEARPIDYYPHKKEEESLEGCITVFKEPEFNKNGTIDPGIYIISVDPFYDDEAADHTSLAAVYVTKRRDNLTPTQALDVAWFIGRPNSAKFHEHTLKLARRYNAKIQCEIAGGGKGLYDYARITKNLDYLEFTPINIHNQEIKKEKSNRTYFMNMTTDDKRLGLTYFSDWLKEPVALDAHGNELWNIHFIYDIGLLDEIIKFNPLKNADRISAQIVKMFMLREKIGTDRISGRRRASIADRYDKHEEQSKLMLIRDGEVLI